MRTAKIGPDLTLVKWSQAAFFLNKFELNQRDVDELYRCNKVNERFKIFEKAEKKFKLV